MTSLDPNLQRIELVAAALGPLRERLAMPDIIGFANRWYPLAIETAENMACRAVCQFG